MASMQVRLKGTAVKRVQRLKAKMHHDGFTVSIPALVNDLVSIKAKERLDGRTQKVSK